MVLRKSLQDVMFFVDTLIYYFTLIGFIVMSILAIVFLL